MAQEQRLRGGRRHCSTAIASKADAAMRRASALGQSLAAVTVLALDRRADHVCLACPQLRTDRERNQDTVIGSWNGTYFALSGL
jgi:hypothetical protein